MALNANEDWLILFAAAHRHTFVKDLPTQAGVTPKQMATDIAHLEALRFVFVKRGRDGIEQFKLAPFGWGYLRTRANDADLNTHVSLRAPDRDTVVTLGAKPNLRLVEPWS